MQETYVTGKKQRGFLFTAAVPSLLVTANLWKRKLKIYQVEIQVFPILVSWE